MTSCKQVLLFKNRDKPKNIFRVQPRKQKSRRVERADSGKMFWPETSNNLVFGDFGGDPRTPIPLGGRYGITNYAAL